jgi:hypothetical protein
MRARVAWKTYRVPGDDRRVIIGGERRNREEREGAGKKVAPVQARSPKHRKAITNPP